MTLLKNRLDEAARHWAQGLTTEEIGVRLGFHRSAIAKLARANPDRFPPRMLRRGPKVTENTAMLAASALWKDGADVASIAQKINVKLGTIYTWASENRDLFPRRGRGWKPGLWGEDEHAEILRLAGEGLSAAQIAAQLPGRSRSAVIGALHRMGKGALLEGKRRARPQKRNTALANRPVSVLVESNFQLSGGQDAGKTLMDLDWSDCRWPVNAPNKGEEHLFCGEPALAGKRYCAAHHGFSFTAAAEPTIANPFGAGGKGSLESHAHEVAGLVRKLVFSGKQPDLKVVK